MPDESRGILGGRLCHDGDVSAKSADVVFRVGDRLLRGGPPIGEDLYDHRCYLHLSVPPICKSFDEMERTPADGTASRHIGAKRGAVPLWDTAPWSS